MGVGLPTTARLCWVWWRAKLPWHEFGENKGKLGVLSNQHKSPGEPMSPLTPHHTPPGTTGSLWSRHQFTSLSIPRTPPQVEPFSYASLKGITVATAAPLRQRPVSSVSKGDDGFWVQTLTTLGRMGEGGALHVCSPPAVARFEFTVRCPEHNSAWMSEILNTFRKPGISEWPAKRILHSGY